VGFREFSVFLVLVKGNDFLLHNVDASLRNFLDHRAAFRPWVAEPFSKWGGTSIRQKNYIKFLWFELATVTSQVLKYDVISYTLYEGLYSTILDKITPI